MAATLERWRDPVFNNLYEHVPEQLAARLTEMAEELTAEPDVAEAFANGQIPRASGNAPVFPQRFTGLPASLTVYNERLGSLLRVAALADTTDLATYDSPPDTKKHVAYVLGHALAEGCSLADIALAAGLAPEQAVTLVKRALPRITWPDRR